MHEEQDTLWHFVMSIVKYRESHYVTILDMYVGWELLSHFLCNFPFFLNQIEISFLQYTAYRQAFNSTLLHNVTLQELTVGFALFNSLRHVLIKSRIAVWIASMEGVRRRWSSITSGLKRDMPKKINNVKGLPRRNYKKIWKSGETNEI